MLDRQEQPFLFNREQTAAFFDVSGKTLDEWNLPREKVGREVYYDLKAVYQFRLKMLLEPDKMDLVQEQAALARRRLEKIELELAELRGELVRVEDAKERFFQIARTFRDLILCIPSRLSSLLAAESNERIVNLRLTEELEQALKSFKSPYPKNND